MTQLLCDCPFRFLHKEILLFVLKINRHTAYLTNLENSGCFDYFCRPVYVYLLGSEFPPSSLSLRKDQPQLSSPRSPVDYNTKKTLQHSQFNVVVISPPLSCGSPCVCPYVPYKRDSQFEEDSEVRRRRAAAKETVSVEEAGKDACHLQSTNPTLVLGKLMSGIIYRIKLE